MPHQNYPRWKYHHSEPAKIVDSAEAEHALGAGWHDSPADVKAPDVELEKEAEADAPPFEDYESTPRGKAKRAHH